jgi:hypothetical protein
MLYLPPSRDHLLPCYNIYPRRDGCAHMYSGASHQNEVNLAHKEARTYFKKGKTQFKDNERHKEWKPKFFFTREKDKMKPSFADDVPPFVIHQAPETP